MRWRARPESRNWSRWFAWRPVRICDQWVWLEHVYRRQRYDAILADFYFQYSPHHPGGPPCDEPRS